ncbi:hypothetical protein BT96DRAFT_971253 [Gymnopus androsaceus JB14]|uniref:Uncharacterized protein n=1 Tax=Gymnopus androsaceus JB14 TaxID=1447944 RepID=A0A6A4IFY5_9AGAR|nr:hypothetical protein BT96DRAFT_971253 [Gymnopus androsaceus JB14]
MYMIRNMFAAFGLFQFATNLVATVYALPTAEIQSSLPVERRTNPGVYMIVTPGTAKDVIKSTDSGKYIMYIKFGDGSESEREKDYSTHNPDYLFKGAIIHDTHLSKSTFEQILKKNTNGGQTYTAVTKNPLAAREWYFVYLGTSAGAAQQKAAAIIAVGKKGMNDLEKTSKEFVAKVDAKEKKKAEDAYNEAITNFETALEAVIR